MTNFKILILFTLTLTYLGACTDDNIVDNIDKEIDENINSSSTCRTTDTPATVSEANITTPPEGIQTQIVGYYAVTKYLQVLSPQMHIFGTSNVSDWMMVRTHEMAENIVSSITTKARRKKFAGHHIFVITDVDPIVPGGVPGQRNTGNSLYTIINQVLVCASTVDSIRPESTPVFRSWDTPIHEFGHAIELALGLRDTTVSLHKDKNPNFDANVSSEYFAWASENWFDARITGTCGVDAMDKFEGDYFLTIFSGESIWKPTCAGRP